MIIPKRAGSGHNTYYRVGDTFFSILYEGKHEDIDPRSNLLWKARANGKSSSVNLTWAQAKEFVETQIEQSISNVMAVNNGVPTTSIIRSNPYAANDVCLLTVAYCPMRDVIYRIKDKDTVVSFDGKKAIADLQEVHDHVSEWEDDDDYLVDSKAYLAWYLSCRTFHDDEITVSPTPIIPLEEANELEHYYRVTFSGNSFVVKGAGHDRQVISNKALALAMREIFQTTEYVKITEVRPRSHDYELEGG